MTQFTVLLKRFLRGFLAGGIASVAAMLAAGVTIESTQDLKQFGIALTISFVSGGLLALDKLIRWQDEEPQ